MQPFSGLFWGARFKKEVSTWGCGWKTLVWFPPGMVKPSNTISEKELTCESNRIAALSGVVDTVQRPTLCEPFAGFWKETAMVDLCWARRFDSPKEVSLGSRLAKVQAPPWPWLAAVPSSGGFNTTAADDGDKSLWPHRLRNDEFTSSRNEK